MVSKVVSVLALAGLTLALCIQLASAECPNGCSGFGSCSTKDMCECYKNYQGNDCSERTCPFGYAHMDTPKGDINFDLDRKTDGWILTNSQQFPAGTYEYFYPDAPDGTAHYYMECSNKGLCERETGLCQCFEGYEGSACQRTACPNRCSSQGTCESIRELGVKGGGTLQNTVNDLGKLSYDLWDANVTYGCRCDPWFEGPDCSLRSCKVGVDPLYKGAGTARYETFVFHAATTTGTAHSSTWYMRLRLFDYYGEPYLTERIPITDDTSTDGSAGVEKAIEAIPNQPFRDVTCGKPGSGAGVLVHKSTRPASVGMSVACRFNTNPGPLRLPEMAEIYLGDGNADESMIVTTQEQGELTDWFMTETEYEVTAISADGATVTVQHLADTPVFTAVTFAEHQFIRIGSHIVVIGALAASNYEIPIKFPIKDADIESEKVFIATPNSGDAHFTGLVLPAVVGTVGVGGTQVSFATAGPPDVSATASLGDLLFIANQFFKIQRIVDDGTNDIIDLDRPFGGLTSTGGTYTGGTDAEPYLVSMPDSNAFTYVSPCAGRGLCTTETGVCDCFRGYTRDNCEGQSIMAF